MPRSFTRTGRWLLTAVTIGMPIAVLPVAAASAAAPPTLPPGYVTLVDDTGRITVSVPPTWTDVDTAPAVDDAGASLPYIAAAPNIESFINTFDTPGVRYVAFPFTATPQTLIDTYGLATGCASLTVQPYNDGVFTGVVQIGTACGPAGQATFSMVAASPVDGSFTAALQVQTATPADQQAFDVVLASFNVASGTPTTPTVPGSPTIPTVPAVPTVTGLPTVPVLPTVPASLAVTPTLPVLPTVPALPTVPPSLPVTVAATATVPGQTTLPAQTLTFTDDTGLLTVAVPTTWTQADTKPASNGNAFMIISPDLATYNSVDDAVALTVPGLIYMGGSYMPDTAGAISFLSAMAEGCTPSEVQAYDDGVFVGHVQVFSDCGGTTTSKTIIVANPPSQSTTVTLIIQLQQLSDPALEIILGSFNVTR